MTAAVEIRTGTLDPANLSRARILLGDNELGGFDGEEVVRFDIPAGRHVLYIRDGYGLSAAVGFRVQHRHCARLELCESEEDSWAVVFGGYHVLRRTGVEPIDRSRPGAEEISVAEAAD